MIRVSRRILRLAIRILKFGFETIIKIRDRDSYSAVFFVDFDAGFGIQSIIDYCTPGFLISLECLLICRLGKGICRIICESQARRSMHINQNNNRRFLVDSVDKLRVWMQKIEIQLWGGIYCVIVKVDFQISIDPLLLGVKVEV